MNKTLIALALLSLATAGRAADLDKMSINRQPVEDLSTTNEPPKLGQHLTREEHGQRALRASRTRTSGPNMSYHGGKIMQTVVSKAIFWGPKWTNATFAADKITGLDQWYTYHSGSHYAATSNEYTGTNGQVQSNGFFHQGHVLDASTASSSSSAVLAEVCRNISPDPNGNGYYPVYTDIPRGNANYCAWHSYGTCGGVTVQFAFFFNLDGDAGCDPQDASGLHSQGLAALANVTAHELSEARTDPASPGAWYDAQGSENGDKCAWTYGAPLVSFSDGSQWKLQGEWSNAAYTAQTGYSNSSGYKGCLSGL